MTPAPCRCGALYESHRTGLTFGEVRALLWRPDPPFRNRRRAGVLGFWHELKLSDWYLRHGGCDGC